jgi:hypothetical protein
MSQIVVVSLKRKMLLWMSDVEMKDGVNAYFFKDGKSDCNGYVQPRIDSVTLCVYNRIGL